eukprot:scaffold10505_cov102-Isochrysis_galbana.AAC.2
MHPPHAGGEAPGAPPQEGSVGEYGPAATVGGRVGALAIAWGVGAAVAWGRGCNGRNARGVDHPAPC